MAVLTGTTPDTSPLLQFHWHEKVNYCEEEDIFPSSSKEKLGCFVGFTPNVGHALTFATLTADTNKIISRSEVRTAEDSSAPNPRAKDWGDSADDSPGIVCSRMEDALPDGEQHPMATGDIEDLVGKQFEMPNEKGVMEPSTIIESIRNHENDTAEAPKHTQF